jgi:hypothetical protein
MEPTRRILQGTCRSTHGPSEGTTERKQKRRRSHLQRRRLGSNLIEEGQGEEMVLRYPARSPRRRLLTAPFPGSPGARWGRAVEGRAARGGRLVSSAMTSRQAGGHEKALVFGPLALAFGGRKVQGRSGGACRGVSIAPDERTETEAAWAACGLGNNGGDPRPCPWARGPGLDLFARTAYRCTFGPGLMGWPEVRKKSTTQTQTTQNNLVPGRHGTIYRAGFGPMS